MLTARVVASLTELPANYYMHGNLSDIQLKQLELAKVDLSRLKLRILDQPMNSMTAFKALCRQHVLDFNVKVIIVDYLQLLSSNRYRNNRELEVSYISREMKNIARELNVCVVATSQLSRSVEQRGGDKRPVLSDLRESGAIEQDADKVIFIYRPEYYGFLQDEDGNNTVRQVDLIMCKNRSGNMDVVRLKVNEQFTKFVPFSPPNHNFDIDPDRLSDFDDLAPF
jgi:replicative DNA helicase